MTLIELLISVVIMGIIIAPIAASIVVGLRTTDATSNRLKGSRDAQLVSIYFPADVGSASSNVVIGGGNTDCSSQPNVVRLTWSVNEQYSGATPVQYTAAYTVVADGAGGYKLMRYYCVGNAVVTHTAVATNLKNATAATASVAGRLISLTLSERSVATDNSVYTYTVSGTRRTT